MSDARITNPTALAELAHWTDIKVLALGSTVGWTPDRSNERTNVKSLKWVWSDHMNHLNFSDYDYLQRRYERHCKNM